MVKHMILWTFKDEINQEKRNVLKKEIKKSLESLKERISEIIDIHVYIDGLETSNADFMLDSTFANSESLKNYSVHPEHVEVANTKIKPYVKIRSCFDFEI